MFRETVTSKDGMTSTGSATEQHALALLRRAVKQDGCRIEVTRTGGAVIERDVRDGSVVPKKQTITLEPVKPIGALSPTTVTALAGIGAREAYLITDAQGTFRSRNGHIVAGLFGGAGVALAARLVERGLVTLGEPYEETSNGYMPETRTPARVSLAARLALFAREHRTRTSAPLGYVKPADIGINAVGLNRPGKRAGMLYEGSSAASCTCRTWTGTWESRMFALDAARQHRQQAAAEFVRSL